MADMCGGSKGTQVRPCIIKYSIFVLFGQLSKYVYICAQLFARPPK